IIADQFERVRDGDRLWFERIFSGRDLRNIENTTLADIIIRNSNVRNLQENVFFFRTGAIAGQVSLDDGHGHTLNLPGLVVQLLDDQGHVVGRTVTGLDGRYQFDDNATAASYTVRVVLGGIVLGSAPVTLVDSSGAAEFHVDITLTLKSAL